MAHCSFWTQPMKLTLTTLASRYASVDALNANFDAIEQAFEDVIWRDGSSPNFMEANLDMNGFSLLNVAAINGVAVTALSNLSAAVAAATASASAAATSETNAAASAASASTSESNAASSASAAATSASNAAASAASIALPNATGNALNYIRQKIGEDGFEYRTPTQLRTDVFAAKSGSNADITDLTALTSLTGNSAGFPINNVLSINGGQLAGMRNKFTNGAFPVDIRNLGASQTFTAGATLAYCVDRWYGYCTGANVTGQRVAGTSPNQYNYRFTGAASVTKIGFAQRIEAANSQDLAGQTATLSVDLANSLLTTVTWTAWYANTADTFGTLASPTRTLIATGTFTVTSTLTRYSTQISVPAAATTGIEIELSVGAQTSGTWTIGRAQLELGSSATVFEHRPIAVESSLCEYYLRAFNLTHQSSNSQGGGYVYGQTVQFPAMRATPTFSTNTAAANTSAGATTVTATNRSGAAFYATTTVNGQIQVNYTGFGSAEL